MGSCFLHQGIIPTQGLNLCLRIGRSILYYWATTNKNFKRKFFSIYRKTENIFQRISIYSVRLISYIIMVNFLQINKPIFLHLKKSKAVWENWQLLKSIWTSRASQVVLVVKNLPDSAGDIRDRVRSLGWEDPLEKVVATHSSIPAWRILWMKSLEGYHPQGRKKLDMTEIA